MTLLIIGILIWAGVHMFKRVMPDARQALADRMGNADRAVPTVLLLLSVVLMVIGYKQAPFSQVYEPPSWGVHLNNLLMVFAVILFGMGNSKGRARTWLRHPMLTGMAVWAVAHLIVNGDLASVVLFGAMLVWALVEIPLINRAEGPWVRPEPGPAAGDIKLLVISAVVFLVIVLIHGWVGPSPFMR